MFSFFDSLSPRLRKPSGFQIDVHGLLASGLNRWICFMDKSELHRNVLQIRPDTTGYVVIIGGIGVVDGFKAISSSKKRRLAVTAFELRNAQYYIHTPMDDIDKNRHGQFDPESFYGRLMSWPDLKVFDGIDHDDL